MKNDRLSQIWLIGGTSDSAEIASEIASHHLRCIVTVTTPTAKTLYPSSDDLTVKIGPLEAEAMVSLCEREAIVAIVDASHPYAVNVSRQAIALSRQQAIPYLRYERPRLLATSPIIQLDSFNTLLQGDYLSGQRVLLTVGYKALPLFGAWQDRATLFARILPSVHSLEIASSAGFTSDRLIALRPPVSAVLEKALWQQWGITLVVTKASGKAGGEDVKQAVASQLGVSLLVVERPSVDYPQQTSDLADVIEFCRYHLIAVNSI